MVEIHAKRVFRDTKRSTQVDAPVCACHGVAAGWQKDKRRTAGGYWECKVKRAEWNRKRSTDPDKYDRVNAQRRDYWHRPGGGYITERRRDLGTQRALIVQRLAQLRQEAEDLGIQPGHPERT